MLTRDVSPSFSIATIEPLSLRGGGTEWVWCSLQQQFDLHFKLLEENVDIEAGLLIQQGHLCT